MSLLLRVAESKQGAERLLGCGLIRTLAKVDFLDARPEDSTPSLGE